MYTCIFAVANREHIPTSSPLTATHALWELCALEHVHEHSAKTMQANNISQMQIKIMHEINSNILEDFLLLWMRKYHYSLNYWFYII